MIEIASKIKLSSLILLLLALPILATCSSDNQGTSVPSQEPTVLIEDMVITIGNLTDMSGPASNAMGIIDMGLEDLVGYYNDHDLIPGVELRVVSYDSVYDPARYITGYQWLKEKGADLIFSPVPAAPEMLKPRCDDDEMVLFGASASREGFLPAGYTFCGSILPDHMAYTYLKWIAENDWDYITNGPARIGTAGWTSPMFEDFMDAIQEYCLTHPDQFEWVAGFSTNLGFTWGPEIEALKDCDYLYPPMAALVTFAKEYRTAGYVAKFIGSDPHAAYMGLIDDADLWDELEGMLFARESRWWNEDGELIDLTKAILYENHSDSAEKIIRTGVGYLAVSQVYLMLEIIKEAVEAVGPEGFNSQALYDAAKSFSLSIDNCSFSYSDTKRIAHDCLGIYELRAKDKDLFRRDPDWQPIIREP